MLDIKEMAYSANMTSTQMFSLFVSAFISVKLKTKLRHDVNHIPIQPDLHQMEVCFMGKRL